VVSVLAVVLDIVLGVVLTAWVVRRDTRRLSPERRARSWSDASFWSAVVAFGPLSIPVHFARTRRTVVGFLLGCGVMVLVLAVLELVGDVFLWLGGE